MEKPSEPKDYSPNNKIENPDLAEELAYSIKILRDAAAELRKKAKTRARLESGEEVGRVYLPYQKVVEAYQKKAATIDRLADLLMADAAITAKLLESGTGNKKNKILLEYELLKARLLSRCYAFFNRIDDLTLEDLDYSRLQKLAEEAEEEREQRRTKKSVPYVSKHPILELLGYYDEEKQDKP